LPRPKGPSTAGDRSFSSRPPSASRHSRPDPSTDAAIRGARALRTPQGRREHGQFLIEGVRLVEDAFAQGVTPDAIFVTPHLLESTDRGRDLARGVRRLDAPLFELSERHLTLVADTETPAGIVVVATLPPRQDRLPKPIADGLGALVLDQVRDPGNIGGILRTAAAAGIMDVVSTEGSADLWAPKVVRAGAGAHFRLMLYPARPFEEVAAWMSLWRQLLVADGRAPKSIYDVDWMPSSVLVLSNEAKGASSWLDNVDMHRVSIPMNAGTESLNVAAAAAILMYEARRLFLMPRSSHP
jgi:RNA methyltransferase, TrmH family